MTTPTPSAQESALPAKRTQFDYLLNAFKAASQADKPADHGYGDKRKALFAYVRELEARATPPIQQGVVEALEPELGDTVRHIPSGEEWLVVYIRDGKLAACGWPDELVPAKDCVLVSRMPLRKKLDLLRDVSRGDGHRAEHARALLRSACLVAESVVPPSLRATSGENGNG